MRTRRLPNSAYRGIAFAAAKQRQLERDMEAAHAEGLHDEIPRDGCPQCELKRQDAGHGR
jgi:hypothetical protein